jgi:hypothetical protein
MSGGINCISWLGEKVILWLRVWLSFEMPTGWGRATPSRALMTLTLLNFLNFRPIEKEKKEEKKFT